ncbi:MAG TPA: DNA cytosine methyltransferase [Thermoguttaceae bacterium]|nr:DNA cytosine methyltransferase [Thermoguttaceae bacterium]
MSKATPYKAFDLFCGGGGSSSGASMAGVVPVGGLDMWPEAIQTYDLNFPNASTYCQNVSHVSAKQVAREVGRVDFLLASPECTSHSVAKGNKEPCDLSRRTAFDVIRFAKAMQPRWIVVENVVSMQRWDAYGEWLLRLQKLGYNSLEAKLDASDFGASQNRRRLFVICDREQDPKLPPKRPGKKRSAKSILQTGAGLNGYNYGFSPLLGNGRARPTLARARRAIRALGNDEAFLIVYYGSDAAGGWQRLDRPLRTITTLDRFALVRPGKDGHEMRMLQPPELAEAMGFPSDYKWPQTVRRNRIKLVGNAVAPPVMEAIVRSLTS